MSFSLATSADKKRDDLLATASRWSINSTMGGDWCPLGRQSASPQSISLDLRCSRRPREDADSPPAGRHGGTAGGEPAVETFVPSQPILMFVVGVALLRVNAKAMQSTLIMVSRLEQLPSTTSSSVLRGPCACPHWSSPVCMPACPANNF